MVVSNQICILKTNLGCKISPSYFKLELAEKLSKHTVHDPAAASIVAEEGNM